MLFSFGLGVWGIEHFVRSKGLVDLLTGIGSFIVAFLFAAYLGWFIRRNFRRR
jgi:hypothetical protein